MEQVSDVLENLSKLSLTATVELNGHGEDTAAHELIAVKAQLALSEAALKTERDEKEALRTENEKLQRGIKRWVARAKKCH